MNARLPVPVLLRAFLLSVDLGLLVYWAITGLHLLPAQWLYAHHDDPAMVAWNWSFLPLDLLASFSGLASLILARRGDERWCYVALASLALTSASGLNAVAFWAMRGDFELSWWLPNLYLLLAPIGLAGSLWRSTSPVPVSQPGS